MFTHGRISSPGGRLSCCSGTVASEGTRQIPTTSSDKRVELQQKSLGLEIRKGFPTAKLWNGSSKYPYEQGR